MTPAAVAGIIGAVIGIGIVLTFIAGFILFNRKRKTPQPSNPRISTIASGRVDGGYFDGGKEDGMSLEELESSQVSSPSRIRYPEPDDGPAGGRLRTGF